MSKIVYLKRSTPFVHEAMGSEAMQSQLDQTHRSIGNYSISKNSNRIASGLTPAEEAILLPLLLGVDISNQVAYNEARTKKFTDIVTKIPGGKKGLELNIGLQDDSKPLGVKLENGSINLPENLEEYCTFRHAVGFPYTAPSVEAALGDKTAWYYIEDPSKVLKGKFNKLEMEDQAATAYLRIKSNMEDVKMYLSVMRTYIPKVAGRAPITNINNLSDTEKIITLRSIVDTRPEKFLEFATDPLIKRMYFVEEAYAHKIIARQGNTFVDVGDNNAPLGETSKEVVAKLWNAKETQRLNRMKAELESAMNVNKVLA